MVWMGSRLIVIQIRERVFMFFSGCAKKSVSQSAADQMGFNFSQKLSISPQASVRLTLATLLYSGKSPDGHHILVSVIQSHKLRVYLHIHILLSPLCVWLISEQCQIPAQGASSTNCTSHQRFPQSAFHHWLQSHHPASGKNIL